MTDCLPAGLVHRQKGSAVDNCFEDLNRELINHFSDTHGRTFAGSFEEFITKIVGAVNLALAEEPGHDTLRTLISIAQERNMTPGEWKQYYVNFLELMFFLVLDNCHQLKSEFARHTYDMLRRE